MARPCAGPARPASAPGDATAAQVQAALEVLNNIEPGDVAVPQPIVGGPWIIEFRGTTYGNSDQPQIGILAEHGGRLAWVTDEGPHGRAAIEQAADDVGSDGAGCAGDKDRRP